MYVLEVYLLELCDFLVLVQQHKSLDLLRSEKNNNKVVYIIIGERRKLKEKNKSQIK